MAIRKQTLDELLKDVDPSEVFGKGGLIDALKKALAERMLSAELDEHLAGEAEAGKKNHRNGRSKKTVLTEDSKLDLRIPRDRAGTFEPRLIQRYQRRFPGFDDKIVSLYARGMTTREIQGHVEELYGVEISPQLVTAVTHAVIDEVKEWQERPLEPMYAIVYLDALRVKIRDEGLVANKAVYVALGVRRDGVKDVLGLWIEANEGAKFWLRVMNELKTRGVEDILIAVVDGLKGFPEAIEAVFPKTTVQGCIVHVTRNSLDYVTWKDRKQVASALRSIYRATSAEAAERELDAFENGPWGEKYPPIVKVWRRAWTQVIPFFAFPPEVRKIIYTTNAIESLNSVLRRAVRARGHFPSDEAAMKLLWLVLRRAAKKWKKEPREWAEAKTQFAIMFGDRFDRT